MQIIPRVIFNGNCKEAIELYKDYFGATVDYIVNYGSANKGLEDQKGLILNAQIDVKGNKFQFADHLGQEIIGGNQITFNVFMEDSEEVKSIFNNMKKDGTVIMEPIVTFFSPCHCTIKDKFGITWQINSSKK